MTSLQLKDSSSSEMNTPPIYSLSFKLAFRFVNTHNSMPSLSDITDLCGCGFKRTVHPPPPKKKTKNTFSRTCCAFNPFRLFWCELLSFGDNRLLLHMMEVDGTLWSSKWENPQTILWAALCRKYFLFVSLRRTKSASRSQLTKVVKPANVTVWRRKKIVLLHSCS